MELAYVVTEHHKGDWKELSCSNVWQLKIHTYKATVSYSNASLQWSATITCSGRTLFSVIIDNSAIDETALRTLCETSIERHWESDQ